MYINRIATVVTVAIGAIGIVTGSAGARPVTDEPVSFTARADEAGRSIIASNGGTLVVENDSLELKAPNGALIVSAPLTFRVDDFEFPISADISGHTATLTPQLNMEHATYKPIALPYEDSAPWKTPYDREQAAWNRMFQTITTGATIGTLVGGIGGGALGCVLGGIAGATVAAATIVGMFGPFLPAAAVGCLGGVIAVGAVGTLAGQVLITAPATIGAVIQYFTTINQPFNSPAK